jgi:hypothetical protein
MHLVAVEQPPICGQPDSSFANSELRILRLARPVSQGQLAYHFAAVPYDDDVHSFAGLVSDKELGKLSGVADALVTQPDDNVIDL